MQGLPRRCGRKRRRWRLARIRFAGNNGAPPTRRLSWRRPASTLKGRIPWGWPTRCQGYERDVLSFCIFLSLLAYNKTRRKFADAARSASKQGI